MTHTNTAVAEGAPLFILYSSLAIAWTLHYERFRMIARAVRDDYPSYDALRLGPPIFNPVSVFGYGPIATSAAQNIAILGRSRNSQINNLCNTAAALFPEGIDRTSWQEVEGGREPGPDCFTEYVFTTHPVDRIKMDPRIQNTSDHRKLLLVFSRSPKNSIGHVMMSAANILEGVRRESPFRATSSLVSNAVGSYSEANARIRAIDYKKDCISKMKGVRTLTYSEFTDELSSLRHDSDVPWTGDERVKEMFNMQVSFAVQLLDIISSSTSIKARSRNVALSYSHHFEERITEQGIMSYASKFCEEMRSDFEVKLLRQGVCKHGQIINAPEVSAAEFEETLRSVTNLFMTLEPKNPPVAIVPSEAKDLDLPTKLAHMALKNLGMNRSIDLSNTSRESLGQRDQQFRSMRSHVTSVSRKARSAMERCMFFKRKSVTPTPITAEDLARTNLIQSGEARYASKSQSKVGLSQDMSIMAANDCELEVNTALWHNMSQLKACSILRRFQHGVAIACDDNFKIYLRKDRHKRGVDHMATKYRHCEGNKFRYITHIICAEDPSTLVVFRKGVRMVSAGGRYSVGDMEVIFHDVPEVVRISCDCYPPALVYIHDDIPFLFKDVKKVDDEGRVCDQRNWQFDLGKRILFQDTLFISELRQVLLDDNVLQAFSTLSISVGIVHSCKILCDTIVELVTDDYPTIKKVSKRPEVLFQYILKDSAMKNLAATRGYMSAIIQGTTDGISMYNAVMSVFPQAQVVPEPIQKKSRREEQEVSKEKPSLESMWDCMDSGDLFGEESESDDEDAYMDIGEGLGRFEEQFGIDSEQVDTEAMVLEDDQELEIVIDLPPVIYQCPLVYKACAKVIRCSSLAHTERSKSKGIPLVYMNPEKIWNYCPVSGEGSEDLKELSCEAVHWADCLKNSGFSMVERLITEDVMKVVSRGNKLFMYKEDVFGGSEKITDPEEAKRILHYEAMSEIREEEARTARFSSTAESWDV